MKLFKTNMHFVLVILLALISGHALAADFVVSPMLIEIESEVTRWGSRSFTVTHRVSQSESGVAVAEGTEERVCVQRDPDGSGQIKSCEIPATVRAAFEND